MIQKTIESALSEQNIAKDVNVSNSLTRSQPMPQDWFDVFISKPNAYLRISFTVDMSLATGRFSSGENLPRRLSLHGRLIPSCSIPQSLSPAFEDLVTNINTGDVAMLEQPRNSYLDFFDFGQSQPESGSDRDPWNGKTVDNILEEVLSGGERLESTAAV